MRSTFCTVTGLAWYSATRDRVEGSRAPGAASAIHSRSRAAIREVLSLYMRDNSSATTIIRSTAIYPAGNRTVVGTARRRGLLLHGSVHPRGGCRAVSVVHRIGTGRCRCRPRRMRPRPDPAAPAPRRPVGARRRRRRRSGGRFPAADLLRPRLRSRQPRRRRHRATPGRDGDDGSPSRPRTPVHHLLGHHRRRRGGGHRLRVRAVRRHRTTAAGGPAALRRRGRQRPSATPKVASWPANSARGRPSPGHLFSHLP